MDPIFRRFATNYVAVLLVAGLISYKYVGWPVLVAWLLTAIGMYVVGDLVTGPSRRQNSPRKRRRNRN